MNRPSEDGVVVLCAANNYTGIKLADQHLAERLAAITPVLYVDPPVSHLTPRRNPEMAAVLGESRLRPQGPGLFRLTPVVTPYPQRPGVSRLTSVLVQRAIRRAVAELAMTPSAIITAWPLLDVFSAAPAALKVFWAQDDFAGGAELFGRSAKRLEAGERRLAESADVIVAANPLVAERWTASGRRVELIPFGCDAQSFRAVDRAPRADDVDLPGLVAGFVGHINDRTDIRLLEAVVDAGLSLLLVGPMDATFEPERMGRLLGRRNVAWVGPKPFVVLPSYLRAIDVGLVPYTDSAFNRGSFPLKTLEYLAAGRPVVATGLPATRWLAGELPDELVSIEDDPSTFAVAARRAAPRRDADVVGRRRAFAAQHSWDRRAEAFAAVLEVDGDRRQAGAIA